MRLPVSLLAAALLASPAHALDLDADSMSDVWQQVHGIATGDRDTDPDADGYANWEEEGFGSDPHQNGAVVPDGLHGMTSLSTDFLAGGDTIAVISIPSQKGIIYRVERAVLDGDNFGPWTQVGSRVFGDGGPSPILVPDATVPLIPESPHQYRVVALRAPAIDLDMDGLDAFEEFLLGTSDTRVDSDGDGFLDTWEFLNSSDPATSNATTADLDGDGLSNAAEETAGTSPMLADSDGDGVFDGDDDYPLDPARHTTPLPNPSDTTAPVLTLDSPANAVPVP